MNLQPQKHPKTFVALFWSKCTQAQDRTWQQFVSMLCTEVQSFWQTYWEDAHC